MDKTFDFDHIKVSINIEKACVSSLIFDSEELIYGYTPFFTLKFRKRSGEHFYLSGDAFNYIKEINGEYYYSHEFADVYIKINQIENGLKWGVKVINNTTLLLEQVELMSLGFYPKLIEEGGKGEIDYPYNEGARITSIARREASGFRYYDVDYPSLGIASMYPNMVSSPFMTYIHNNNGIYLAMLDKEYTPKHIDFHVVDNTLRTILSVFTNRDYAEDYEMDFDSVMLFYRGNYYDACELYRSWFYQNKPNGLKTIKERYHELPKWYHESPVVITYPVCGKDDADTVMEPNNMYPYTNGLDVIDYYAKKMNAPVMVTLMQWESTAPWAPPYVWPPYGDINNFYTYRDELHKRGHYLGLYTSGFGWTNVSHRRKYDKTEEFEKDNLKDIMCSDSNGYIFSNTVKEIRLGYDVCPALKKSKELFINEANKMIDGGVDYVQILDQNHGGNPYFCYSDKHGHVPAPGKWQVEETLKLLSSIDKKNVLFGCESAAAEPYIDQLMFSDNRFILNYHIGEPIPMYAYIYHEFVNNFMGNQICYALSDEYYSLPFRIAHSFICGDMSTLVIDGNGKLHIAWGNSTVIDDTLSLEIIKNLNKWRVGKYEEYLHLGKMIKPLEYECDVKHFSFMWGDYFYTFKAILSSAYTNGKNNVQFFVNYDNKEQSFKIKEGRYTLFLSPNDAGKEIKGGTIVVPPLSAIALKIS